MDGKDEAVARELLAAAAATIPRLTGRMRRATASSPPDWSLTHASGARASGWKNWPASSLP